MRNLNDAELPPELWKRVRTLFRQLQGKSLTFVNAKLTCENSPVVAEKVRQLLEFADASFPFLEDGVDGLGLSTRRSSSRASLSPGDLLCDRFRILSFVGAGGVGEVYEAADRHLNGQRLALKILNSKGFDATSRLTELSREFQLARRVTHPNVCRVFDLAKHRNPDGTEFDLVTMELLEGVTLAEFIRERGRLKPELVAHLVRQLADGLNAAHCAGVLHRDLKPKNIVILQEAPNEFRAVIMDFGLARELRLGDSSDSETWSTGVYGTPAYMAPEQLCGRASDTSTDVYAFGLVLFEMLTGRRPFEGSTEFEIAARRLNEEPLALSRFRPNLDGCWQDAISACLQPDPGRRPKRVHEIVQLLTPESRGPWRLATALAGVQTVWRRYTNRRRKSAFSAWAYTPGKLWLIVLLALVMVVLSTMPKTLKNRSSDRLDVALTEATPQCAIRPNRLVVMPFRYEAEDPTLTLVAHLLTWESINVLSQLENLEVVSFESARAASSKTDDKAEAARNLCAALFVGGSVALHDNNLFIRLESSRIALDASEKASLVLDTKQFEQPKENLRLLVRAIADWLGASLLPGSNSVATLQSSQGSFEMLLRYTEARLLYDSRGKRELEDSLLLLNGILEEEPKYVQALVLRSNVLFSMAQRGFLGSEAYDLAGLDAENALEIDIGWAEAHAAMGLYWMQKWKPFAAERHFLEAIRLKPSLAEAEQWYSDLLSRWDRLPEALERGLRAYTLNPLFVSPYWSFAWLQIYDGDYAEAIRIADQLLEFKKDFPPAIQLKAEALALSAHSASNASLNPVDLIRKAANLSQENTLILLARAYIEALFGNREEGRRILDRLQDRAHSLSYLARANVYAALGEKTEVYRIFKEAAEAKSSEILFVRYLPLYDDYRNDSEYQTLFSSFSLSLSDRLIGGQASNGVELLDLHSNLGSQK